MPIRTTAIEAARAKGWSKAELRRRTGLSLSTIYNIERGAYETLSGKTIAAIMAAFPDLPYERLFVPVDSRKLQASSSTAEPVAA